jgi:hypothetical protein
VSGWSRSDTGSCLQPGTPPIRISDSPGGSRQLADEPLRRGHPLLTRCLSRVVVEVVPNRRPDKRSHAAEHSHGHSSTKRSRIRSRQEIWSDLPLTAK